MHRYVRYATAVVVFLAVLTVADAQEVEKVEVSANLVSVNVSVTDSRGRYVPGIDSGQFEVFDDGVRQRIAHFSAGDAPFSLGIVYDMHPTTRERAAAVLGALKRFAGALRRDDDFFLLAFNERGSAEVGFVPTAEQIGGHLSFIPAREPNSLYDAVYLAAEKIRSRPGTKKALLVISDGIDHNSRHSYSELRRKVGEFDVQLYGIVVSDSDAGQRPGESRWAFEDLTRRTGRRTLSEGADAAMGRTALDEMTRASGGGSYFPQTEGERELFGVCARIALELRSQYTVGFYPSGVSNAPRLHKIRVRVNPTSGSGRVHLSYREGYRPRKD